MTQLIYPDLVYKIRSVAFDVYNHLGAVWHEKTYEKAMQIELDNKGIPVVNQKEFVVLYSGQQVGFYRTDLICDDKVIIELKAVPKIFPLHQAQIISYLKITGKQLGLLINFGAKEVDIQGFPNLVTQKKVLNYQLKLSEFPLFDQLTKQILNIAREIHTQLGPGFFHQIYRRAF